MAKSKKQLKKQIKELKRDLKQSRANVSRLLFEKAIITQQLNVQTTNESWANDKTRWGL